MKAFVYIFMQKETLLLGRTVRSCLEPTKIPSVPKLPSNDLLFEMEVLPGLGKAPWLMGLSLARRRPCMLRTEWAVTEGPTEKLRQA